MAREVLKLKEDKIFKDINILENVNELNISNIVINNIEFQLGDNEKLDVYVTIEYCYSDDYGKKIDANISNEYKLERIKFTDEATKILSKTPLSPSERSKNIYEIIRDRIFEYFKSINLI